MLETNDVYKSFDGQPVLRGVSFAVQAGEIIALLGPSGCGKTTLLRIIAGLETAERGVIRLDGRDLTQIPIHKRRFGMVFQDYALFPHKNVKENVIFGLRMMDWEQSRAEDRVQQVLQLVGLGEFGGRAVHELSGGEQQRVALARALAPYPRLLLLDEPLGSLDRALRERLMGELRMILKRAGSLEPSVPGQEMEQMSSDEPADNDRKQSATTMTSIYVTHDQEEAFAIADRILVMNRGQIEQAGSPVELYREPKTPFVARFLGMENLLKAEFVSENPPTVRSALGELQVDDSGSYEAGHVTLLIRPEAARLSVAGDKGRNVLSGQLTDVSFRGRHQVALVEMLAGEEIITLRFNFDSKVRLPTVPSHINIALDPAQLRLLAP